jgi:hypothetical protein
MEMVPISYRAIFPVQGAVMYKLTAFSIQASQVKSMALQEESLIDFRWYYCKVS